jgi:hypothetical protein
LSFKKFLHSLQGFYCFILCVRFIVFIYSSGIKSRTSGTLGKCSTTELHPQPLRQIKKKKKRHVIYPISKHLHLE